MAVHQDYFPTRIGDQLLWLTNYRNKISSYQAALGYTAPEIATHLADLDWIIYLLGTVKTAASQFDQGISTFVRTALEGPVSATLPTLPTFALPTVPPPPAAVAPGTLKRLFAFIKNLKTRPGYNEPIGENLGVIGSEPTANADATPTAKADARSGEVVISFKKMGHMGVYIEGQVADETEWSYIAIDTSNPYNDTRPLKVAGQPEHRRYRLCYWDGDPTKVWSDILEVVFGG